jgi:hypothetical protein
VQDDFNDQQAQGDNDDANYGFEVDFDTSPEMPDLNRHMSDAEDRHGGDDDDDQPPPRSSATRRVPTGPNQVVAAASRASAEPPRAAPRPDLQMTVVAKASRKPAVCASRS